MENLPKSGPEIIKGKYSDFERTFGAGEYVVLDGHFGEINVGVEKGAILRVNAFCTNLIVDVGEGGNFIFEEGGDVKRLLKLTIRQGGIYEILGSAGMTQIDRYTENGLESERRMRSR